MTIRSEAELAGMRTSDVDALCAAALARRGAEPTPARLFGFPGSLCISVNDEAVHGVPGERRLERGDLVKLDLVASVDGFVADSAITVGVPPVAPRANALARAALASA